VLSDATHVYLKVSDCCADPPGYTLRLPRAGGAPEELHRSERFMTGLAQDATAVYTATSEGLKIFAKSSGSWSVIPNRLYTALAVHGGRVYGLAARKVESHGVSGVVSHVDGDYALEALAVDDAGLYLLNRNAAGRLLFVPMGGGAPRVFVAAGASGGGGGELAQDAEHLYWATGATLQRTRKSDGRTDSLHVAASPISGVVADATHVTFATLGTPCARALAGTATFGGTVSRVVKATGAASELVSQLGGPTVVAVDDTHVYFVTANHQDHYKAVRRVPK
jgi:hypothetical protein